MLLKMTDEDIVRRFHAIVSIGAVYYREPPAHENPTGNPLKPTWTWQVTGREPVRAVAEMLWPWLGGRRTAQIVAVLDVACGTNASWETRRARYGPTGRAPRAT